MTDPKELFKINRQSKLPLYDQIEQNFRELIIEGKLAQGETIPGEWELAELYGVSRLTVRKALDNLARQKWINRRQGVGTFVSTPPMTSIAPSKLSFSEQMRSIGRNPSSRMVDLRIVPAEGKIARLLSLQEGDPVVEIIRVRLADGVPILYECTYLSQIRFPGLEQSTELETGSLYDYLHKNYQVSVVEMDQTLQPVLLSATEASYLDSQAGSPGILSEVVATSADGIPVEYCWSIASGETSQFYFRFKHGENES